MLWKLLGPGIIIILIPASNCPRVARNTEPFTPSTERLIQEFYIWDPKSASWERAPLDSSDVGSLSTTTRGAGFAQCPLRPFNFSQLPQSSGDDRSPLGWRHGKVKKSLSHHRHVITVRTNLCGVLPIGHLAYQLTVLRTSHLAYNNTAKD